VLSASYKFKVLSLDQRGNEFIVMMDLAKAFNGQPEQLGEIETLIVQNARARFEITVPAVYWRMDEMITVSKPAPLAAHDAVQTASLHAASAASAPVKPPAPRYEPFQADEVAAFKQALLAASAEGHVAAPEKGVKVKSGPRSPRSYTLLTGFEDTEMPESNSSPALSSTQYGDLI
jgi:N-acetyl-beta-hexosaminidase